MLAPSARFDEILKTPKDGNLGAALIAAMEEIEPCLPAARRPAPEGLLTLRPRRARKHDAHVRQRRAEGQRRGTCSAASTSTSSLSSASRGAHDNGEFYTPPSIVQTIVNVIEPEHGIVLDPACGTGGMFVQSSHFIERAGQDPMKRVTFYGHEKNETTAKLAQINLAVNGLEGKIRAGNEAITYYKDPHELVGKCDFVMANPPFNVDEVDAEKVKGDKRLPFGLPGVNKGKEGLERQLPVAVVLLTAISTRTAVPASSCRRRHRAPDATKPSSSRRWSRSAPST